MDVIDKRAGVRRKDRVGGRLCVERTEDRLFEPEVLEGGFHDQRGLGGKAIEGMRVAETGDPAVDPVLDRVGIQIQLGSAPRETVADALARAVDRLRIDVVDQDLPAVFQPDLGDPRTHHPGADDAERRHTSFIASNGWRQARQ